jgi:hypothetical protein
MERVVFTTMLMCLTLRVIHCGVRRRCPRVQRSESLSDSVNEYRQQVGKFTIRPATEKDRESGFVGAIKLAVNHRLVIALTKCDCDSH